MTNDDGTRDAERGQQRVGIGRQLLNAELITERFGRFAESDLVGRNDAEAGLAEDGDRLFPGRGAEIASVQQYRCASVGGLRFHVHVGHGHIAALRSEGVAVDIMGIVEALELGAVDTVVFSSRRCCNAEHSNADRQSEKASTHGILLPASIRGNQASDRAFEMRRNGANHIIGLYGPERLLPHVAVTVLLSSVTSTRATRLLSKIHQRTFISRRTGGRHGARTARDEGQLSAHL